ncbi:MAG: AmmeMemoRadiSam system protein B [Clostridia bacterium]|nr:AmmeMemoRadiSam system protein B [Clostridia bacterium]
MKKKIFIFSGLMVIAIIGIYTGQYLKEIKGEKNALVAAPAITCRYYDEKSFMTSVKKAETIEVSDLNVLGGVTPHHLLADHMIAQFFKEIAANNPNVIVLIGPNHGRIGRDKIHTGSWSWQTPFGILEAEKDMVKQIAEKTGAGEDMNLLEKEHSIAALIPYVKYYLPEVQIVPLVLHGNLGIENSKKLANIILACMGDKECLVIGSVDFSHYLTPDKAEEMDEISIKAIKKRDFLAVSRMDNDYLDSPPTIMTLFEIMNRENVSGLKVLDHSNSSIIAGEYAESNTSYYTLLFYKKDKP